MQSFIKKLIESAFIHGEKLWVEIKSFLKSDPELIEIYRKRQRDKFLHLNDDMIRAYASKGTGYGFRIGMLAFLIKSASLSVVAYFLLMLLNVILIVLDCSMYIFFHYFWNEGIALANALAIFLKYSVPATLLLCACWVTLTIVNYFAARFLAKPSEYMEMPSDANDESLNG